MQGMRFLLLNENGQPVNNGVITQRVTEERYMCTFLRPPQVSRLCHVDEIGTWNLFPNDEAVNAFIAAMQPPAEDPPAPGAGEPPPGAPDPTNKKVAKKKAAKKKVSKKRNAN